MLTHEPFPFKTKQLQLGPADVVRLTGRFRGVTHLNLSFCPVRDCVRACCRTVGHSTHDSTLWSLT